MSEAREKKLTPRLIFKSYLNWMAFCLSLQQREVMQGPALVKMLGDIREDLYPGDVERQQEMMERHLTFFNTEPNIGAIIPGIVLGMEAEKASGADVPPDLITAIKNALMGPFAGIGDALLPGTLCPLLLSIALGLSQGGSVTGVIFYIVTFLGIMAPLTWFLFSRGATLGAKAAELVLSSQMKDDLIRAMNIIGITVVGAITCSVTNIKIGLVYTSGEMTLNLNNIINGIYPKLVVLLSAFGVYYLVAKKNWSVGKMMLLMLGVAIVGYFTKILAP